MDCVAVRGVGIAPVSSLFSGKLQGIFRRSDREGAVWQSKAEFHQIYTRPFPKLGNREYNIENRES